MTLPVINNKISVSQINVEIKQSANAKINFSDFEVRRLLGVPSGKISISDGYGKQYVFTSAINATATDLNLRAFAVQQGWDQSSAAIITIDTGVVIGASSTGAYALTIDGSWPKGLTLINKGTIVGKGGAGGRGGGYYVPGNAGDWASAGSAGGPALFANTSVTIDNTGTIGGGGGGGGGGGIYYTSGGRFLIARGCGGGGGGGAGFGAGGQGGYDALGQGKPAGSYGATGTTRNGGLGGPDGTGGQGGVGGAGGSLGAGGGGGATTNSYNSRGAAGAGPGAAVSGNSYVTWASTGTILGTRA